MIFVLVGTHTQPFDRLLKKIDNLIEDGKIVESVVAQIGISEYIPKNYKFKSFFPEKERSALIGLASIVITHAGAGNIIDSIKVGKRIIVVPRLKDFGEHVDNHQLELAKALEKSRKAIAVYDIEKLGGAIFSAKRFKFKSSEKSLIIEKLEKCIFNNGGEK